MWRKVWEKFFSVVNIYSLGRLAFKLKNIHLIFNFVCLENFEFNWKKENHNICCENKVLFTWTHIFRRLTQRERVRFIWQTCVNIIFYSTRIVRIRTLWISRMLFDVGWLVPSYMSLEAMERSTDNTQHGSTKVRLISCFTQYSYLSRAGWWDVSFSPGQPQFCCFVYPT